MAVFRLRGLVPRRPALRILLLLVVAVVAIVVAAVVFTGAPIESEPAAVAAALPDSDASDGGGVGGTGQQASGEPADGGEASGPEPVGERTATTAVDEVTAQAVATGQDEPDTAESPAPQGPSSAVESEPAAVAAALPDSDASDGGGVGGTGQQASGEPAAGLIEQLRPLVATPSANIPDYDRDNFAGWLDSDGDCVNTRHEVLQSEAATFAMAQSGCSVAAGEWYDPYTDRTYTNPRDLDVDHVVALADAWVSGAYAWADDLLDRFSNDLGNLNAIQSGENRSKSAKGPADYTPSASGARCEYLVQYATVKIRWQLSITPDDFAAVQRGLGGCNVSGAAGDVTRVAPVRTGPPAPTTTSTAMAAAPDCHPAYEPCLPNLSGDALNCGDLTRQQKPVTVKVPGTDPYRFDRDGDGRGCTS